MKKVLLLSTLIVLLIAACKKEKLDTDETAQSEEVEATERSSGQVTICHVNGQGEFSMITVNENALEAHLAHGDHLPESYYADTDGDGYGTGDPVVDCTQPEGYVTQNGDCDDNNPAVRPGAAETCDGVDNDCDGQTDEGLPTSTYYVDADGDGYGVAGSATTTCSAPEGYVTQSGDCNDSDASIHPGAEEVCGDGIDQDCDGSDASCLTCPVFTTVELNTLLSYQPNYGWWLFENTCYNAPLDTYQEVYLYYPAPGGTGAVDTYDFKNGSGRVHYADSRTGINRSQTLTGTELQNCKLMLKLFMEEMDAMYPNGPIKNKCDILYPNGY